MIAREPEVDTTVLQHHTYQVTLQTHAILSPGLLQLTFAYEMEVFENVESLRLNDMNVDH
jgi:hypothetical protein